MEKAKINIYQLIVLLYLFEMGTSLVIALGTEAENNAWIAILLGSLGGIILFQIYHRLYTYYPTELPTSYFKKITGKYLGKLIGFLYILYYTYLASRVLRDFGELLLSFAFNETPLSVVLMLMTVLVIYAVNKGIEVIARSGEINIIFTYFLAFIGLLLILISGLIDFNNLTPILGNGIFPVLKVAMKETVFVPFGEAIAFSFILPYLNEPKNSRKLCSATLLLSGINLSLTSIINVGVITSKSVEVSPFPLLITIQLIKIGEIIERLDIFFFFMVFIGAFFKISLYFYVATIAVTDIFRFKNHRIMVLPMGFLIFNLSLIIASSFQSHIREGLKVVPLYLHFPFQIVIPSLLLVAAFFKNKGKNSSKNRASDNKENNTSG